MYFLILLSNLIFVDPNSPEVLQIASVTMSSIKVQWEQSTSKRHHSYINSFHFSQIK